MRSDEFTECLRALAEETPPSAPLRLERDIWREIRQRRKGGQRPAGWWAALLEAWLRPHQALAAVAFTIAVGVLVALQNIPVPAEPSPVAARGFAVFSPAAPLLPSTLLASHP